MSDDPRRTRSSRVGGFARRVAIDLTPLRASREYRRLWFGLLVSTFGSQFTIVATFLQVFQLTDSAAAVGLIGLVAFGALVIGTLVGSSFLDALDRRKIMIGAQAGYATGSAALFLGTLGDDPPVWLIYVSVAIIAGSSSIDGPTRNAMTPRLIGRRLFPAAAALNQLTWNAAGLFGPALAGVVVAELGFIWAYGIDLASIAVPITAALLLRPMPPEVGEGAAVGWRAVREGFAYLRGRRVLQSAFTIDLVAMVFGMPRALFSVLAITQFDEGATVAGLLFAAPALGAVVGAATTGWVVRVRHQGLAVVWAVVAWGAGIVAFGLAVPNLWLACLFLAVAGAADVVSAVFRNTIVQLSIPDALRGRMSGINLLVVAGGPRLGDLEAGLVAQAFSPVASVISGGLLCIAGAGLIAWLVPEFRRYRSPDVPEPDR